MKDGNTALGVIQRLLYENPLYNYVNEDNVNILVFGFTELTIKFIDVSFEIAQVKGYKLNITAVSEDATLMKANYLAERPAFCDYFNVNSNDLNSSDTYGNINFCGLALDKQDNIENAVTEVLLQDEKTKYAYIFIDFNDDSLNQLVAKACVECNQLLDNAVTINYVASREIEDDGNVHGINRFETIESHKDFPLLKRMAFNCHLVWNNSEHLDIRRLQRKFNSSYNYEASFSNVLSIKYKLNSAGISMDNPETAAKQFYELISSKTVDSKKMINNLMKYEHQRWMVNLVMGGWSSQKDLSKCVENGIKDKKNKLHPCIVPCDDKWRLGSVSWKENSYAKWDDASDADINDLDELDKVSVTLHRLFKRKAEEMRQKDLFPMSNFAKVEKLLSNNEEARNAFKRYVLHLKEINTVGITQTKLHEYYKVKLDKALSKVPARIKKLANSEISAIEQIFEPIICSQQYVDYKATDRELIKNIPFILTYKTNINMGIPLGIEYQGEMNNTVLFENIASAIKINPSRITYLFDFRNIKKEKIDMIVALKYILKCMESRNLRTSINLLFSVQNHLDVISDEYINSLYLLSKRINKVDVIYYENEDDLETNIKLFIKEKKFDVMERNQSSMYSLMRGFGCYRDVASFEYGYSNEQFKTQGQCDYLKYLCFKTHLRVSDMFDFKGAFDSSELPEMQLDYMYFWNLYKGSNPNQNNEKIWKALCNTLDQHSKKNDQVVSLKIPKKNEVSYSSNYFVPAFCYDSVKKIIQELHRINKAILGENAKVEIYTTTSCKISVNTTGECHKALVKLFSNPYLLSESKKISIRKEGEEVKIICDTLIVRNLSKKSLLSSVKVQDSPRVVALLDKLIDEHYLLDGGKKSENGDEFYNFCYSSQQIKALLTSAGRILELYVYYKALETNWFDDVVNSCEVIWNEDNVSNEFDIILTKGFRTIIVECKAQAQLDQNFYYKISQLNQKFGINSTAVIVADTNEKPWQDTTVNDMQRSRGNELNVITISDPKDIKNIGIKLKSIMDRD